MSDSKKWIPDVVRALDEHTDPETCARTLEACGRRCAPESLVRKARQIFERTGSLEGFLAELGEVFDALELSDGKVYVVYPQCYCEQIRGVPVDEIPDVYCNCSVGWVKEIFEGALGRPVRVTRRSTVIAGDSECRFEVDLS